MGGGTMDCSSGDNESWENLDIQPEIMQEDPSKVDSPLIRSVEEETDETENNNIATTIDNDGVGGGRCIHHAMNDDLRRANEEVGSATDRTTDGMLVPWWKPTRLQLGVIWVELTAICVDLPAKACPAATAAAAAAAAASIVQPWAAALTRSAAAHTMAPSTRWWARALEGVSDACARVATAYRKCTYVTASKKVANLARRAVVGLRCCLLGPDSVAAALRRLHRRQAYFLSIAAVLLAAAAAAGTGILRTGSSTLLAPLPPLVLPTVVTHHAPIDAAIELPVAGSMQSDALRALRAALDEAEAGAARAAAAAAARYERAVAAEAAALALLEAEYAEAHRGPSPQTAALEARYEAARAQQPRDFAQLARLKEDLTLLRGADAAAAAAATAAAAAGIEMHRRQAAARLEALRRAQGQAAAGGGAAAADSAVRAARRAVHDQAAWEARRRGRSTELKRAVEREDWARCMVIERESKADPPPYVLDLHGAVEAAPVATPVAAAAQRNGGPLSPSRSTEADTFPNPAQAGHAVDGNADEAYPLGGGGGGGGGEGARDGSATEATALAAAQAQQARYDAVMAQTPHTRETAYRAMRDEATGAKRAETPPSSSSSSSSSSSTPAYRLSSSPGEWAGTRWSIDPLGWDAFGDILSHALEGSGWGLEWEAGFPRQAMGDAGGAERRGDLADMLRRLIGDARDGDTQKASKRLASSPAASPCEAVHSAGDAGDAGGDGRIDGGVSGCNREQPPAVAKREATTSEVAVALGRLINELAGRARTAAAIEEQGQWKKQAAAAAEEAAVKAAQQETLETAVVAEVLAAGRAHARGERKEWVERVGWHRREDTTREGTGRAGPRAGRGHGDQSRPAEAQPLPRETERHGRDILKEKKERNGHTVAREPRHIKRDKGKQSEDSKRHRESTKHKGKGGHKKTHPQGNKNFF